jgi:hypothetical protein
MRPIELKFWPVLMFALLGCSALVDFPSVPKEQAESGVQVPEAGAPSAEAGLDATFALDTGASEAGPDTPDASESCEPSTHAGCAASQLCCDRDDGAGARCFDTLGARECGACGQACANAAAPHCGAGRICECEPGSGQGCAAGQRCLGSGASARCAECETDDDCATSSAGKQCVQNRCVQCDRGALTAEASDDQGCNEAGRPICNERNECAACTSSPDNCPGDQVCNGTLGCFGCNLLTPLDTRNCGGTRPICRAGNNGQPQCQACRDNNECGAGYCDSRPNVGTGACTSACSPTGELGANGCTGQTPFCKQIAGNEFACRPCAQADCSGATPYCATEAGSRRGYCVACINNSHCSRTPGTPVCDASSGSCRPRQASDCPASTVFDPATMTCLDCRTSAECADTPATPVCVRNSCVQCEADNQCNNAAAPLCAANNRCVPCNMTGADMQDARCAAETPDTPVCVTRGNRSGQCGVCEPRPNNPPARGCPVERGFCRTHSNSNELGCHECDPDDRLQTCPGGNCRPVDGIYRCLTADAGTDAG